MIWPTVFSRLRCHLAVWMVWAVAVFAALAPTVSHALKHGLPNTGIEICTSQGTRWELAPTTLVDAAFTLTEQVAPGSVPPPDSLHTDHCPFCLLSGERFAPLPSAAPAYLQGALRAPVVPPLQHAFFYASTTPLAAQPRGPPLP